MGTAVRDGFPSEYTSIASLQVAGLGSVATKSIAAAEGTYGAVQGGKGAQ